VPVGPNPPRSLYQLWSERRLRRAISVGAVVLLLLKWWVYERVTHSRTDDAFVESHIVNVASEMVSGRIVRFLPYEDRVNVAQAKLGAAAAELRRQQTDLERLRREIPFQVQIAGGSLAAAQADRNRSEHTLTLTHDDVKKGIEEVVVPGRARTADRSSQVGPSWRR
jgi:membrane fusion protein, multidrug efflux system